MAVSENLQKKEKKEKEERLKLAQSVPFEKVGKEEKGRHEDEG